MTEAASHSTALPRISCRAWWVGKLHAAFFKESRTRGEVGAALQGILVRRSG
jgi:hypothetical protein